MIPTKPISPLTATAAAVPSVAAATSEQPHAADVQAERGASSSPSVSTSSTRRCSRITTALTTAYGQEQDDVVPAGGADAAEDPRVDGLERVRVLLLDERLHRGEERGRPSRRRAPAWPGRVSSASGRARRRSRRRPRRRRRPPPGAGSRRRLPGRVRDHERRAEPGPGRHAEQVRVGERVAEHALVGRARGREHRADEQAEHDPRHPELPEDRRVRRGRAASARQQRQVGGGRLDDRADPDPAGPTATPTSSAASERDAASIHATAAVGAPPPYLRPRGLVRSSACHTGYCRRRLQRARDGVDEVDDPRPPARGDRSSITRDRALPHGGDRRSSPAARRPRRLWPQHRVSARTIRSGLGATMYSAES